MTTSNTLTLDRRDLLETLATHRALLRGTADGLTNAQAAHRSTVSELTIGGLIKHVTETERAWAQFMVDGEGALGAADWAEGDLTSASASDAYANGFRMLPGETLAELLTEYETVAAATDVHVAKMPDLDLSHSLPAAPWFEPGARWSLRRVLLHIIAETAQHAGHADIIREAIDGKKSMG